MVGSDSGFGRLLVNGTQVSYKDSGMKCEFDSSEEQMWSLEHGLGKTVEEKNVCVLNKPWSKLREGCHSSLAL